MLRAILHCVCEIAWSVIPKRTCTYVKIHAGLHRLLMSIMHRLPLMAYDRMTTASGITLAFAE